MFLAAAMSTLALTATLPAVPAMGMTMAEAGSVPYHRTSYRGTPDLHLALALVVAGGGPAKFDSTTLVGTLAGASTGAEVKKLTAQFGAANVKSFLGTFTYAIDDTLRIVQSNHIVLPSKPIPNPKNGPLLAAALYKAGVLPDGKFDVGHMLEHAISHPVHVVLMHDIDANPAYGHKANANFHTILTQAVFDLKAEYGL
jgi:hypothetical protein